MFAVKLGVFSLVQAPACFETPLNSTMMPVHCCCCGHPSVLQACQTLEGGSVLGLCPMYNDTRCNFALVGYGLWWARGIPGSACLGNPNGFFWWLSISGRCYWVSWANQCVFSAYVVPCHSAPSVVIPTALWLCPERPSTAVFSAPSCAGQPHLRLGWPWPAYLRQG